MISRLIRQFIEEEPVWSSYVEILAARADRH